jgi:hypothetical protein
MTTRGGRSLADVRDAVLSRRAIALLGADRVRLGRARAVALRRAGADAGVDREAIAVRVAGVLAVAGDARLRGRRLALARLGAVRARERIHLARALIAVVAGRARVARGAGRAALSSGADGRRARALGARRARRAAGAGLARPVGAGVTRGARARGARWDALAVVAHVARGALARVLASVRRRRARAGDTDLARRALGARGTRARPERSAAGRSRVLPRVGGGRSIGRRRAVCHRARVDGRGRRSGVLAGVGSPATASAPTTDVLRGRATGVAVARPVSAPTSAPDDGADPRECHHEHASVAQPRLLLGHPRLRVHPNADPHPRGVPRPTRRTALGYSRRGPRRAPGKGAPAGHRATFARAFVPPFV